MGTLRKALAAAAMVVLLGGAPLAMAQDAGVPQQRADAFLTRLVAGDIGSAYDDLFRGSRFVRSDPQLIVEFKRQTATLPRLYGAILGFERVSSRVFGTSVAHLMYILQMERHPIVCEFYFYHVNGDWILATLRYKDQLDALVTSTP